ncbi:uncharacterized protein K02A2.6-like [Phymastichus coffea]|uniref:uncharacterized protein K02A2.6-like n=1 Tax=Phymastichus coffea TaxID=108790 RepID=UPI00273BF597|nr:uncharacterized protein K02A2.6-like [Phymastichus coffea]
MAKKMTQDELEAWQTKMEEEKLKMDAYVAQLNAFQTNLDNQAQQLNDEKASLDEFKKKFDVDRAAWSSSVSLPVHQVTTIVKGTIGNINEFNVEKDDSILWYDRLQQYYESNDVVEDKKVSVFLTLIGSEGYALLKDLCIPVNPANKTLQELERIMREHKKSKPNVVTQRFLFKTRKQKEGESVMSFIASLRKISIDCEFGATLEENLRDQILIGVTSKEIKKKLLSEKNLTYNKAVELARSLETVGMDATMLETSEKNAINYVTDKRGNKKNYKRDTLSLAEESRELVTLNTHKGLFRPKRLKDGIASTPGLFIRVMDNLLKDIPDIVTPLYELLRDEVKWEWTPRRKKAFTEAKEMLCSNGYISHIFPDGIERPIAFGSRLLTKAERNYAQIDKEALALTFIVTHFYQYLYGRQFILETDHKPLIHIFGPKKGIPQMAASKLQRYALILAAYDFIIKYIKGKDNCVADSLSRNLISKAREISKEDNKVDYSFLNFVTDNVKTLDTNAIAVETQNDLVLSKVKKYVLQGWPKSAENDEHLKPYKNRKFEITIEQDVLMWGHRIIIPKKIQNDILNELHCTHLGIVKMKGLARSYIWWPNIDKDIENIGKSCKLCLENANNPVKSSLHVWKWPECPNYRIHVDFCGPINNFMYLVFTDAHSKWVDVKEMKDITADSTIDMFREYFCVWGLPNELVTDNGPSFTSEKFSKFLEQNYVKHIRTAPHHPPSNGAAENAVKTFKYKFKLLLKSGLSRHEALCKYLFSYRSTPHCTTGCTPAELQLGHKLRTRFDPLKPFDKETVLKKQESQRYYYRGHRNVTFDEADPVMVKDYSKNNWRSANILEKLSPVTNANFNESNSSNHPKDSTDSNIDLSFVPSVLDNGISDNTDSIKITNHNVNTKESPMLSDVYTESIDIENMLNKSKIIDSPMKVVPLRRSKRTIKPRKILDL